MFVLDNFGRRITLLDLELCQTFSPTWVRHCIHALHGVGHAGGGGAYEKIFALSKWSSTGSDQRRSYLMLFYLYLLFTLLGRG